MAEVINGLGTALTSLLTTMQDLWTWLNAPISFFGLGEFSPLALVAGGGLIIILGYVIVRSLII